MSHPRPISILVLASVLAGGRAAAADPQDAPPFALQVGDRVSVALRGSDAERVVGEVTDVDGQGLVVRPRGRAAARELEWSSVSRVYISLGRRPNPGGGALTGVVALGVPLAYVAGRASFMSEGPRHFSWNQAGHGFAAGALVGGALGAALGSIKTERWMRARPTGPHVSLDLRPSADGGYARLAVRF
jgi:hypothetical protein